MRADNAADQIPSLAGLWRRGAVANQVLKFTQPQVSRRSATFGTFGAFSAKITKFTAPALHFGNCRIQIAPQTRSRRNMDSSLNISTFSNSSSGCRSSSSFSSTSTAVPSLPSGKVSVVRKPMMISSIVSKSSLKPLRLARSVPVSRLPLLPRPEKSPSTAMRNLRRDPAAS